MEPHRIFHSEGDCIIRTTTSKLKNMHYFLFNDMLLLVSAGKSLFNKDEWRVHFQLLLSDLSFSILRYEKGLLITGPTLKMIVVLETAPQLALLMTALHSLKSALPSVDPTSIHHSLSPTSLPHFFLLLKATWLSHPRLHYVVVLLSFLVGVCYWWMGKITHK